MGTDPSRDESDADDKPDFRTELQHIEARSGHYVGPHRWSGFDDDDWP